MSTVRLLLAGTMPTAGLKANAPGSLSGRIHWNSASLLPGLVSTTGMVTLGS